MIDKDYIFKVGDKIIANESDSNNTSWHSDFLVDILQGLVIIKEQYELNKDQVIDTVRIKDNKVNHPSFKC